MPEVSSGLSFACTLKWVDRITRHTSTPITKIKVGIYGIERIERLAGCLPRRQERLVLAWAELHQEELRS